LFQTVFNCLIVLRDVRIGHNLKRTHELHVAVPRSQVDRHNTTAATLSLHERCFIYVNLSRYTLPRCSAKIIISSLPDHL